MVGVIGGVGIEIFRVDGLVAEWFTGKSRFVDTESHRIEQFAVGWYLVTGVEDDYVADNHIFAGYGGHGAVAHHLHSFIVVDLIEDLELLVGFLLENESEDGCHQYGNENAYGFEKYFPVGVQSEIFI